MTALGPGRSRSRCSAEGPRTGGGSGSPAEPSSARRAACVPAGSPRLAHRPDSPYSRDFRRLFGRAALRQRSAILVGPLRNRTRLRTRPWEGSPFRRGATVFENSTACAPSIDPDRDGVSRFDHRRSMALVVLAGGAKNNPVTRPGSACVPGPDQRTLTTLCERWWLLIAAVRVTFTLSSSSRRV